MSPRHRDYFSETRGHFAILVDQHDPSDVEPEDRAAGRVWRWMLVDTTDPDRGILDGDDDRPLSRAEAEQAALRALDRESGWSE